jgi:hypothetical protein
MIGSVAKNRVLRNMSRDPKHYTNNSLTENNKLNISVSNGCGCGCNTKSKSSNI